MRTERDRRRAWSFPIAAAEVPQTGRRFELRADEQTRAAVAAQTGLAGVPRLEAKFDVKRDGTDGLRVTGTVAATVGQICVVSLEPIENEIEESVDAVFLPNAVSSEQGPRVVNVAGVDEEPEPLVDGRIDLGAIATEFLVLGIDPHPRKRGVVFEVPAAEEDPETHPFAALAALKKGAGGEGR